MYKLLRPIVLTAVVLAIPIVPFLLVGETLEAQVDRWIDAAASPSTIAAWTIGLLATDVFLPVPSSVVSAFAGNVLGFWAGTAACWIGMSAGAGLAFGLARWLGRPAALWLCKAKDLDRTDSLSRRFGPLVLVLARPVPVLAEASVLFLGTTDLSWRRFLLPVGLSNLGIAAVYAALGHAVALPVALAAAIALPLLAATMAKVFWPASTE
ncbi:MAG: VTT domain-containing protein [Pirellulales bacterium]|nr:VTT domain-containing protein [Pirellulales bacterium]